MSGAVSDPLCESVASVFLFTGGRRLANRVSRRTDTSSKDGRFFSLINRLSWAARRTPAKEILCVGIIREENKRVS